jgi:hypothetical protein
MTARNSVTTQGTRSQIGSKTLDNISYPANAPCPNCGGCKVEVTSAKSVGWSEATGFLAWSRNPDVPLLVRWLVGIPVWTILVILYLCLLFIAFAFMIWMACTIILMEAGGKLFAATLTLPDAVLHTWHEDYRALDAKCRLCGYTWTWRTDEPLPAGRVDAGLIAAGTVRLEEERRAEERRQQEAAHWNSWHNPDNPWNNPGNTSSNG